MIKISKQNNSLIVEGIDNVFYPNNGDNSYPLNSLIVVTDNSDMATFRSVATNDVLFSGLIKDITINGEAVTKDNIIQKFDAVSNSSTGGGGGGTVDAYTKEEADNKFASKEELTNVQTVANDADTKVDALTTRVEGVETTMGNKQDTLVSGTNIKTINNQSILGEGNIEITDYYTKTEADEIFATTTEVRHQAADISALQTDMRGKQATLVSGENIKTINSQSIIGSGDLTISGVSDEQAQEIAKIPTLETELAQKANVSDVPTVQTDYQGTNKKYIYSEGNIDNNNKTVVSNIVSVIDNTDTVKLGIYEWGGSLGKVIKLPSATTTLAGVMSAADKTKLDSIPETIPSQSEIDGIAADVSALESDMANKQPTLVSGTNIKTINNQSILGEGNLEITGGEVDLTNYYTKTEADGKFATITGFNEQAANISALQTAMDGKQPTLVSGTNIKTINGESVLGEGNIEVAKKTDIPSTDNLATKDELTAVETVANNADAKADAATSRVESIETSLGNKQDTLVSGENIKTINSESILGTGDIQINAGAKLVQLGTPAPFNNFWSLLYNAVSALNNGTDYTDSFMSMNETICKQYFDLFKTLKNGDLLSTYDVIVGHIFRIECNPFSFKHSEGNNAFDIIIKYLGDFSAGNPTFINYTSDIYVHYVFYKSSSGEEITEVELKVYTKKAGPTLQKNDFKTINGESVIGEGNIEISGGISEEQAQEIAKIPTLETDMMGKQDTLVSGTNIKTINSQSILGEGNIEVTIPDATTATSGAMSAADKTKLDSMSNEWTGTQSEFDALTTKDNNIIYYVTE